MPIRSLSCLALLSLLAAAQEEDLFPPPLNALGVTSVTVDVEMDDSFATVVVEQTLHNPGAAMAEADFYFPLPEGAAASGLQLSMNGRFFGGNLLTREKARDIYDRITRRWRDPALLDCVGKDLYRCRVFPVPAAGEASIRLAWRQPLTPDGLMRRFTLPLDVARFNHQPARQFRFTARVRTGKPLQALTSPTHDVAVERVGAQEAVVRLDRRDVFLARDLEVLFSAEDAPLGAVVNSFRRRSESGYFVLTLDAAFAAEKQAQAPRDVVVAIDTSNSCGREGVDSAAAAVAEALRSLRAGDRYALMAFSTEARRLTGFLHPEDGMSTSVREIYAAQPVAGRSDIAAAIRAAVEMAGEGLPGTGILVVTDGLTTEGPADDADAAATAAAGAGHRVGFLGIGAAIDTAALDLLGEKGEGDSSYASRGRSAVEGARRLLASTRAVPLTNVSVDIEGVEQVYPERLRLLRPGASIHVAGRYRSGGKKKVCLSALVGGTRVARELTVDLREVGGDAAVARIWAARRIGFLLEESRQKGEPGLHLREIVSLGHRFGIVTPHTSLLVVEEADRQKMLDGLSRQPLLNTVGGGLKSKPYVTGVFTPQADLSDRLKALQRCESVEAGPFDDLLGENRARQRMVGDSTFYKTDEGIWVEASLLEARTIPDRTVPFLSEEWLLLSRLEEVRPALALGRNVMLRLPDGTVVRIAE